MKHLIFMRHGKAEKSNGVSLDFDRKLEDRGISDIGIVAKSLGKTKFVPELLVASPAMRTKSTAMVASKELKIKNIELDTAIYEASISDLMHLIRGFDDQFKTIMVVGHNPSITGIIGYLTETFIEHVPTSGIVVVKLNEATWKLTQSRSGKVVWSQTPKGFSLV
ncbi:MAG: histidine phosphatase family protein [Bacteroidia bacterium]|jgi:phosphohistidine phosphatase|nr:histidine phosphatase family protein [Bacteroidia bacterium]